MKHEVTSLNTKRALAASLKKLLQTKPCSLITVSELIRDCGVNRKTFYYHFADLPALVQWMFEQEAVEVVRQFDLLGDCTEAVEFVIDYVDSNAHMINCIYDSMGNDGMKRFLYDDFVGVIHTILEGCVAREGLEISEDFLQFLSQFYSEAIGGTLVDWFQKRIDLSREELVGNVTFLLREGLPAMLRVKAGKAQKP